MLDAHCHLQDSRLLPRIDDVVRDARSSGVDHLVSCAAQPSDWSPLARLAKLYPGVHPFFGLHPWYTADRQADWHRRLEEILVANPRAGVGEIGLDHAMEDRCDEEQTGIFMIQLELARRLKRPVSIHCRRAWEALHAALSEIGDLDAGFLVHSYSGSVETAAALLDRGGYLSFSGSITRRHNRRARTVAATVPLDRLLVETDAPDITPMVSSPTIPGSLELVTPGPNQPRYLGVVVAELARLRKTDPEKLGRVTEINGLRFLERS